MRRETEEKRDIKRHGIEKIQIDGRLPNIRVGDCRSNNNISEKRRIPLFDVSVFSKK
jgi:hypothetical protein